MRPGDAGWAHAKWAFKTTAFSDEGILSFCLPALIFYGGSLLKEQILVANDSAPSYTQAFVAMTADDHLVKLHLTSANYMTTAIRTELPASHALRRLLKVSATTRTSHNEAQWGVRVVTLTRLLPPQALRLPHHRHQLRRGLAGLCIRGRAAIRH